MKFKTFIEQVRLNESDTMLFKKSKYYSTYDGDVVKPLTTGKYNNTDCLVFYSLDNLKNAYADTIKKYSLDYLLSDKVEKKIKIDGVEYYSTGDVMPYFESSIKEEL